MPPRYAYWTILAGGLPTAFRATEREELMPTFQRLREKHPDAEMKWFARGKLWNSPEDARRSDDRQGSGAGRGPRDESRGGETRPAGDRGEARGRDWRPGGNHRDPRQKFVDAKKARNAARRQERFDRRQANSRDRTPPPEERFRPTGPAASSNAPRGNWSDRDRKPDWRDRPPRGSRDRFSDAPRDSHPPSGPDRRSAQSERPRGPRFPQQRDERPPKRDWQDRESGRPDWRDRPRRDDRRKGGGFGDRARSARSGGRDTSDWRGDENRERPRERQERGWNERPRTPGSGDRRHGRDEGRKKPDPRGTRPSGPAGGGGAQSRGDWRNRPPGGGDRRDRPAPRDDWRDKPPRRDDARGGGRNFSGERKVSGDRQFSGERQFPRKPQGAGERNGAGGRRPFDRGGFARNQSENERPEPRPRGPNREPRPGEGTDPTPPPRPNEPAIKPPGPPERGSGKRRRE